MADPVEIDPQVLAQVRSTFSPFNDAVQSLGFSDLMHRGIMFVGDPVVGAIAGAAKTILHGGSLGDNVRDSIAAQRARSAEVLKAEQFLRDESPIASTAGTVLGFVAGLALGTTEARAVAGVGELLAKGGSSLARTDAAIMKAIDGQVAKIDSGELTHSLAGRFPATRGPRGGPRSGGTRTARTAVPAAAVAPAAGAAAAPGVGAASAATPASGVAAAVKKFLGFGAAGGVGGAVIAYVINNDGGPGGAAATWLNWGNTYDAKVVQQREGVVDPLNPRHEKGEGGRSWWNPARWVLGSGEEKKLETVAPRPSTAAEPTGEHTGNRDVPAVPKENTLPDPDSFAGQQLKRLYPDLYPGKRTELDGRQPRNFSEIKALDGVVASAAPATKNDASTVGGRPAREIAPSLFS